MRNVENEFQDNSERKYAYDFDYIVHTHLINRLRTYFSPLGVALEIGSFEGAMTSKLQEEFSTLEVLEPSKALGVALRARFGEDLVVHEDFIETFEPSGTYSDIFLVHTLEHLDDPIYALKRIAGWLGPGGRLFVAVPNAIALSRQIAVQMGIIPGGHAVTPGEYEHGHRRTYSLETLLLDVREAGLKPLDFGGVVVKPMANFQLDKALQLQIITEEFIEGCDRLARIFPDFSSSVFVVCEQTN